MDFKPDTWGLGDPIGPDPDIASSQVPARGRGPRQNRARAGSGKNPSPGASNRTAKVQGGIDAVQEPKETTQAVDPEDRDRARDLLEEIGARFAENRKKGKSTAYEEYQRDLAVNMNYLVLGGVMNLKEISQTLMQIEEYRKQSSETGKTQATLLGEWLSGGDVPGLT